MDFLHVVDQKFFLKQFSPKQCEEHFGVLRIEDPNAIIEYKTLM